MNHSEIELMWKEDSKMNPDELHSEALRTPLLHSKYHEIYNKLYIAKKIKEADYKELLFYKNMYYNKKLPPEEYEKVPFNSRTKSTDPKQLSIIKQDVNLWIESDKDIIKLKSQLDYYDHLISYIKEILKMIHDRSFHINHAIEWRKFKEEY